MSDKPPTPPESMTAEPPRAEPVSPPGRPEARPARDLPKARKAPPVWHTVGVPALVAAGVAAAVALLVSAGAQYWGGLGGADGRLVQQGKVMAGIGTKHEVYYPVPYDSPPNVQLEGDNVNWSAVRIAEQKADHFTLESTATFGNPVEVHWRAEGTRKGR